MARAVAAARLADPKHSGLFFFFFFSPHALPVGENMEFGGGGGGLLSVGPCSRLGFRFRLRCRYRAGCKHVDTCAGCCGAIWSK